ncbi:MAG: xanthine dehydrogenase family protein molybdopterin-binding subunit [Armatimonadota bacterium]|nr:xanthine dehydrogenase family protein molybdopterin-binding subunit [Armatimonadota bacterium]MDR7450784.1 xanthine dehydrogenase family protein molybdopterin-binding subunit [Armatimonadota bacterium]MDR7466140.1 xanthine dehydrogenase family protein molybdopterin-binding subunit [Armatimonadota bacterium]MDR7493823.1 xanthine dehydrogenase family protein molybdopterin-binding subunit [Armatimonadota bacterium]MDR7499016.1 xanthine dehydrogenase family protein molybdopterin-binding subunit 
MTTVIGRPTRRIEGLEKVTGTARYTEDLRLPGMVHARLLLSPHAHARVRRLPREVAASLPGVVAVVTEEDLPSGVSSGLLAEGGEALYCGHPVAVVLAASESAAADAVDRLAAEVEYEVLPAVLTPEQAMAADAPLVRPEAEEDEEAAAHAAVEAKGGPEVKPRNVANVYTFRRGDVEAGFRDAHLVVERTYRTGRLHQAYLEPQAAVAAVDPITRAVTVYTSTQAQFYARAQVAQALGYPESRVRIVPMTVGGAFGGKFKLLEPLAAALAVTVGRPVRVVLTRREDFLLGNPGPESEIWLRTGVTQDGRLVALQARLVFDAGAEPGAPASIAAVLLGGYYKTPNLLIESLEVLTNKPPCGAYRAPGAPQATFAIESQMDIIARELGIDPVELRLRNCSEAGDPMPTGRPWQKMGLRRVLEALQNHPKYRERRRADGIGYGVAVGGWTGGVESASACVRANTDGTFQVLLGMVDITGTATTMALIAAEVLGVPLDRVRVVTGDTDQAPYAGASGGSKITYTVGAAVKAAAEEARRQILTIAASELEARVEDLEIADGSVRVKGTPQKGITLAEIASKSMSFGAKYPPVNGTANLPSPRASPGFAAHLVKVRVDRETGQVALLDHLVIQDVGFAINPAAVEGQMRGGAAQGIGWGLLEAMVYDDAGTLLTWGFTEYPIPKATEVPPTEVVMVEVPSEFGPFGAKGVGEPPVVAGGAAIANAVADATGVRLFQLPITPSPLLRSIAGHPARA